MKLKEGCNKNIQFLTDLGLLSEKQGDFLIRAINSRFNIIVIGEQDIVRSNVADALLKSKDGLVVNLDDRLLDLVDPVSDHVDPVGTLFFKEIKYYGDIDLLEDLNKKDLSFLATVDEDDIEDLKGKFENHSEEPYFLDKLFDIAVVVYKEKISCYALTGEDGCFLDL